MKAIKTRAKKEKKWKRIEKKKKLKFKRLEERWKEF